MEIKMTQKELAEKINEKPQVVTEYEAGKATYIHSSLTCAVLVSSREHRPNVTVLQKMQRVLKVKLTGADIGSPLARPGKKNA